jgi:uncharacterized protein
VSAVFLDVRVVAGARQDDVGGHWADASGAVRLIVRVRAPPEDGRANAAVCAVVAEAFDLPKSAIAITAGAKSRLKTLTVETSDSAAFAARLNALTKATT